MANQNWLKIAKIIIISNNKFVIIIKYLEIIKTISFFMLFT